MIIYIYIHNRCIDCYIIWYRRYCCSACADEEAAPAAGRCRSHRDTAAGGFHKENPIQMNDAKG